MHPVVAPLLDTFRLNTRLFLNTLEGVDDAAARRRPNERTNSLAFVALHLVDSRHFLAGYLSAPAPANPFAEMLAEVRSIDELAEIPSLDEIRAAWRIVSAAVEARLAALGEDEIRAPSPQRFPVDDATVLGGIAFLGSHDAYHVGQMALLRKLLGFPAMAYA